MATICHTFLLGLVWLSLCPPCWCIGVLRAVSGSGDEESACDALGMSFLEFTKKFGRAYEPDSEEYKMREALFLERSKAVKDHNCAPKGPWKATVNHLVDWTDAELQQLRGHRPSWGEQARATSLYSANRTIQGTLQLSEGDWPRIFKFGNKKDANRFPESYSWINLTAISEPRDQGACGSCWAFASETVLRAHAELSGRPHRFSVSQIVSCAPNPKQCGGKGGCEGSTAELAFEYIMHAGAVDELEMIYPHGGGSAACPERLETPREGTTTPFKLMEDGSEVHGWNDADGQRGSHGIGMTGWTKLPENRQEPVMRALVESGPIAVAVAAGFEWNFYWNGIMNHKSCDKDHVINHAVVLFGYGIADQPFKNKLGYWHIKNSWGAHWGEHGNLRLERTTTEEKMCGWDRKPEQGSGCIGGPKEVWVCGTCGVLYDTALPHFAPVDGAPAKQKGVSRWGWHR